MNQYPYKTWVEINSKSLHNNITELSSILTNNSVFCAVIKANAYGHDIDVIARLLSLEGVKNFAVDSIDEALIVKKRVGTSNIFILGFTPFERLKDVVANGFIQTVYDEQTIPILKKLSIEYSRKARINIKIETGTNRQGLEIDKTDSFIREISKYDKDIDLVGVSSHFADAENVYDQRLSDYQLHNFHNAMDIINKLNFYPPYVHFACSAASIDREDSHFTMSRFGIAMYGLWSSTDLKRKNSVGKRSITLQPVLTWKTRIAQIKDVPSGQYIGYSRKFLTDHPIRIAILPVGYYDGYSRSFSNKSYVLIKGQKCPVIGSVCMNMLFVDVSTIPSISMDDTVTLLGRDGMNEITAEQLAEFSGTINYEVVTKINPLLPRVIV